MQNPLPDLTSCTGVCSVPSIAACDLLVLESVFCAFSAVFAISGVLSVIAAAPIQDFISRLLWLLVVLCQKSLPAARRKVQRPAITAYAYRAPRAGVRGYRWPPYGSSRACAEVASRSDGGILG